jgi:hypothetical protein
MENERGRPQHIGVALSIIVHNVHKVHSVHSMHLAKSAMQERLRSNGSFATVPVREAKNTYTKKHHR